ncbi:MAG: hypothetical protein RI894_1281 [Bacteroidota bacterium]|jgi:thiol:disulfide interchange protein DsbD
MKLVAIAALAFGLLTNAYAQIEDPLKIVKWSAEAKAAGAGEYDIVFTATIEKGWYTYSQTLEKGGPIPTLITLKKGQGAELVGKAREQSDHKKEGIDDNFGVKVTKFAEKVSFTQHVKVKDAKQPLRGTVEFMTCNNNKCLPPSEYEFTVKLPAASTQPAAVKAVETKPAQKADASTSTSTSASTKKEKKKKKK